MTNLTAAYAAWLRAYAEQLHGRTVGSEKGIKTSESALGGNSAQGTSPDADDPEERAGLLADLLFGAFGADAAGVIRTGQQPGLAQAYAEAMGPRCYADWNHLHHPRGKDGRFIPKGSGEAVAAAKSEVHALKGQPATPENVAKLASHLNNLTVPQLRDLHKQHAVTAPPKVRADLVAALHEKLLAKAGEQPTAEHLQGHVADAPHAGQTDAHVAHLNDALGRLGRLPDDEAAKLPGGRAGYAQHLTQRAWAARRDAAGGSPALDKLAGGAATQAVGGQPPAAPLHEHVYQIGAEHLAVDPQRFQYKLNTDNKAGVTDEFKHVEKWNPDFAGVMAVWRDPADGKTYVVNGHHRAELAKRLGVDKVPVRYIEAPDAGQARARGALINIAEGRGTAVDAAKFMRDAQVGADDFKKHGVSLKGKVAADATDLARLAPEAFDRLAQGKLDQSKALAVGRHLGDHDRQRELFKILDRREEQGKDLTPKVIEEMAKEMAATPSTTKTESTLFGDVTSEESLFVPRNELKAHVRAELAKEVNDWKAVASDRRAGRVGGTNVLDVEGNKAAAAGAAESKGVYDTLVNSRGRVSDALNAAAAEYAAAKTKGERDAVRQRAVESVRAAVAAESAGGSGGGGAGAAVAADAGATGRGDAGGAAAPGVPAGQPAAPAPLTAAVGQALPWLARTRPQSNGEDSNEGSVWREQQAAKVAAAAAPKPFHEQVLAAAQATGPEGRFYGTRAFIGDVYAAHQAQPGAEKMPAEEFKRRLVGEYAAGRLRLANANLVERMDPDQHRESETPHPDVPGVNYHFVEVPGAEIGDPAFAVAGRKGRSDDDAPAEALSVADFQAKVAALRASARGDDPAPAAESRAAPEPAPSVSKALANAPETAGSANTPANAAPTGAHASFAADAAGGHRGTLAEITGQTAAGFQKRFLTRDRGTPAAGRVHYPLEPGKVYQQDAGDGSRPKLLVNKGGRPVEIGPDSVDWHLDAAKPSVAPTAAPAAPEPPPAGLTAAVAGAQAAGVLPAAAPAPPVAPPPPVATGGAGDDKPLSRQQAADKIKKLIDAHGDDYAGKVVPLRSGHLAVYLKVQHPNPKRGWEEKGAVNIAPDGTVEANKDFAFHLRVGDHDRSLLNAVRAVTAEPDAPKAAELPLAVPSWADAGVQTPPAPAGAESHELTRDQYLDRRREQKGPFGWGAADYEGALIQHEREIQKAQAAGKTVPPHVLAEYPHLAPRQYAERGYWSAVARARAA